MKSSLPPTPAAIHADERTAVQLLAKNSILHNRLRFARGPQLEQTRAEIARLRVLGIALENAARAKRGQPPMDEVSK